MSGAEHGIYDILLFCESDQSISFSSWRELEASVARSTAAVVESGTALIMLDQLVL